jgi:protein involved in polysaccharide export with SLBB domain
MSLVRTDIRSLLIGLLAVVGACASEPLPPGDTGDNQLSASEYRLGVGDTIDVFVSDGPEISGEFRIGSQGVISMSLIGEVKAAGLTPEALQTSISDELNRRDLVRAARVTVQVAKYRSYYILGEVTRPGQYPFDLGLTVTKAVATAGGFTYRADTKAVYVTREGSSQEMLVTVTAASSIGPGDTIRVAERSF